MKKILIVFGTRPEAIKMAPLVKAFLKNKEEFITKVCVTAQHREMLDQVLDFFQIKPDYDLNLMSPNQNLYQLTANILLGLKNVLEDFNPDYVFVHGDTTTSMASALASFYNQSKVCHVEAGLRTYNLEAPYPEEMNRQVTSRVVTYHFAPTLKAQQNLLNEGIKSESIIVTGNTVIDALLQSVEKAKDTPSEKIEVLKHKIGNHQMVLITGHRRENHGEGLEHICNAIIRLAKKYPEKYFVYPVHMSPNVKIPVYEKLGQKPNILLIEPVGYQDFIALMQLSTIIITDSGGVQEEAPSLGKPVLVTRENTERPEAVEEGTVILVGTDEEKIYQQSVKLLEDKDFYHKMSNLHNPYGDGRACERIINFMKNLKK